MKESVEERKTRDKIELGIKGEEIAFRFLKDLGYRIIGRNKRVGHSDIDILAEDGDFLVFVEVRTKSREDRGMPEETLSGKKMNQMKKTAELYMLRSKYKGSARLDAVCIIVDNMNEIKHLEHYIGV